ncbi:NmrA family NAD(P)-binding protein [Streptomyces sp. NPDC056987]|uniref:NAD(P)H-binding protein n=1 Tax=Streptomyces sp. NPDC056987 TaxID=3345988 RepID=UPI00362ECF56
MENQAFLVLGATGRTGSRVAAGLRQRGMRVRARSRSTTPGFDWHDRTTWAPALDGVTAAYIVAPQQISMQRDDADQNKTSGFDPEPLVRFSLLAASSGVRHLVLLSGRTALSGSHFMLDLEEAVQNSGAEWTVLRPGSFAQNFVTDPFRQSIIAGTHQEFDTGGRAQDFIDIADIAEVAVRVLTTPGHEQAVYELSGPEALTGKEAAEIIGRTLGRPIEYSEFSADDWAEQARAQGLSDEAVDFTLSAVTSMRDGYFEPHDGVQKVLGREPRRFEDFVLEAAAAGAWGPVHPD